MKPDILLRQVRIADYNAIVFLGGDRYPRDNTDAIRIAGEGGSEGKVLAAMGHAAFTLIKADMKWGIVQGEVILSALSFAALLPSNSSRHLNPL